MRHVVGDRGWPRRAQPARATAETPDCVSIDHRRGAAFAPGDLIEYFRAGWDLGQDIRTYVEVVHRLSELGAVCTHAGHGVSHEGFDAEWHGVDLLTVEGDMVNRCEAFDDADLDAAIARFERAQPTGAAVGKRDKPSRTNASWRTSWLETGTPWRRYWPTTCPTTIAVES